MRTHRGSPGAFGRARNLMVLGVALAGVAAVIFRLPDPVDPALRIVGAAIAGAAILVVLVMRLLAASAVGDAARTLTVTAWAIGVAAALFGWVIFYMGAPWWCAAPGLLAFLLAITLAPVPRR